MTSRGLGQTELLEAAPTRRLIVPVGHDSWWGVDPSTVRVALATVDAEGRHGVSQAPFPGLEGGERLAAIWRRTYVLAHDTAELLAPGLIAVEQPSGKTPNPMLLYACGVIMGAVWEAVRDATGRGVKVVTCTSSQWKALACGYGQIYKPKGRRARPEDYQVLVWARGLGYSGTSWDDADAMGVAEWARRTFALEVR